jgi:hypothetical protein
MDRTKGASLAAGLMLALALGVTSGCKRGNDMVQASPLESRREPANTVMSGTTFNVTLGSTISSETASVLDTWRGTLTDNVETRNGDVIPAGSSVSGVVAAAEGARRGSRAMLDLSVRLLRVNGRDVSIVGDGDPVIAGSTRARNLGVVAGGAVAGALIGRMVGDGRNGAVGGLLGGAAAAGVVSRTRGYPVELKAGTVMSFMVRQTVALR